MSYERAYRFTLAEEKGFADDPDDPGGKTRDGIASHANPLEWADGVLTDAERDAAYRRRWDRIRGGELPPPVAISLFDFYFQSGAPAVQALQRLVGANPDGSLGPKTVEAVRSACSSTTTPDALALALIEARAAFLSAWIRRLPVERVAGGTTFREARVRFMTGFMRRLARLAFEISRA